MDRDYWQQLKAHFDRIMDEPEPAREALIQQIREADADLARDLAELVDAEKKSQLITGNLPFG